MEIKRVSEVLSAVGLNTPDLNALVPSLDNYSVLLMQPSGDIEGSAEGVRNRDRHLASRQFGAFLASALETQADLAITPEYSMPWETLVEAIRTETIPRQGKLWALGCESIKYSELEKLKQDLAPFATILFEQLPPNAQRFIDPLAYVFLAEPTDGNGAASTVVLIQFKTYPMGDDDHFEINSLQLGTRIYQFGGNGTRIKLVSLICSDVLAFRDEDARKIYDRSLIVHIQLNEKPRQEQYRRYRDLIMGFVGDQTEIISLNWAQGVCECCGDQTKEWNHIPGSAWYLKPREFDDRDVTLCGNHKHGLYYTWLQPVRAHALFFNFDQAVYHLVATKVTHIGIPAATSRRRGPQLITTAVWNNTSGAWEHQAAAEDGFASVVGASGDAEAEIKRIADANPLAAERVLALCAGEISFTNDWHCLRHLDSCIIDASEVIRRLTFCQDTDTDAHTFRVKRLRRCGRLWDILNASQHLPPALADLRDGFRLEWSQDFPHQNLVSGDGKRATVIYMGENADITMVEATAKSVSENLRKAFQDPDARRSARQRLAVWFRDGNDQIVLYDPYRSVKIDQTGETSEFDIGREK